MIQGKTQTDTDDLSSSFTFNYSSETVFSAASISFRWRSTEHPSSWTTGHSEDNSETNCAPDMLITSIYVL